MELRRVITGHDAQGVAKVLIDEPVTNLKRGKSGVVAHIWNTDSTPASIAIGEDIEDVGMQPHITPPPTRGSRMAVIDYMPGNTPSMHRTETIDYIVVLSGEIDMVMDDSTVHLKAGDVMVQRGTYHAWHNRTSEPCRIAFVLIDAEPLGIGHPRTLEHLDGGAR
jgi:mannose-6-phosphate isomerase-like protein (cupin superfamily)